MNEEPKIKLGMTEDEVKEILGEPDRVEVEESVWKDIYWHYLKVNPGGYTKYEIKFIDGGVAHVFSEGEKDLTGNPDNEKVINFPKSRVE